MKKIFYCLLCAVFIPLFSMEDNDNWRTNSPSSSNFVTRTSSLSSSRDLEQSQFIPQTPITRGFGFTRSVKDFIWSAESNLIYDLESKTFDPSNSSYPRKLQTTVESLVTNNNSEDLAKVIFLLRANYCNQVKIEDAQALLAHKFLEKQNRTKQNQLKQTLEEKDKTTIKKVNDALKLFKETINMQLIEITKILEDHTTLQQEEIAKEGKEIRQLKKALLTLHKINKNFALSADAYCSDDESKDPEEINEFYTNQNILEKISQDQKTAETKTKIESMLKKITIINSQIQGTADIRY